MSSRYTSAFDDLLAKNRRELDALYEGTGRSRAGRPSSGPPPRGPAATTPAPARAPESAPGESIRPVSTEAPATDPLLPPPPRRSASSTSATATAGGSR